MPKTFVVSDERVNSYGFRVLTSGIDTKDFVGNPVGLWNHSRSWRGTVDEVLPIARWNDLKKNKDGSMTAMPEFDQNDDFAKKIEAKVEGGFLNAASIGITIIEVSDDPSVMLPGQKYSTVTKCRLKEISIADIPSNAGALALYDREGNLVNLNDEQSLALAFGKSAEAGSADLPITHLKNDSTMLKDVIAILGLGAGSDETAALGAIKAAFNENTQLKAELETLRNAEKTRQKGEVDTLLNTAIKAGRIAGTDRPQWEKFFALDFDSAKTALSNLPAVQKLSDYVDKPKPDGAAATFTHNGKTFSELSKESPALLQQLKENDLETFKQLYKAEFGKDYRV